MALPILDGNQSATTLSTILTGGQHIPAHTVVSLGSQAITDMRSAVSGSVVSISNFPASQTVAGTVTASIANSVTIGSLPYTTTITGIGSQFGQGGGLAGSVVTAVPVILSSNGNIGGSLMSYDGSNTSLNVNIKGTVPAISGTVTANLPALNYNTVKISFAEKSYYNGIYKKGTSGYVNTDGGGIPVYAPIDEKFHGGVNPVLTRSIQTGVGATFSGIRWNFQDEGDVQFYAATTATDLRLVTEWYDSSGEVSVSITPYSVEPVAITNSVTVGSLPAISGTVTVGNSVTIGSLPAISGTVTANLSKPTWTNYSGTIVTAGTAVTAISTITRSYLLAQVTTGQMFLNIGATATSLNSVYFSAGQGFAWETSVPQGLVSIISAVTGTNYVLKEG
jgi:hypothetical protein